MIREEIHELIDRGIIRPSKSPWAAQVLCFKKKDGTMRLCVDWRRLNSLLVIDSGGLGDMQSMFSNLKGKRYFTQIDLASGFHQLPIAEKDKHKTAFRDADGQLWEFNQAGFGLTVLPAAFTRIVKTALAPPEESVVSWFDDILITSTTWEEHLETIHRVFRKLTTAGLSVNFAKCNFAASVQVFLGMMVDINGIRPAPSKIEAVAKMPRPTNIEELRTFLGLTGYLRQFVENYTIIAAPLTNILRNKEFATKRARKLPIPWTVEQEGAFANLKKSLASPTVLAFPDSNQPFTLHTDASSIGAGAVLTQYHGSKEVVIAYASHRFSRTDSRRGPTERECMAVLWGVGHYRQFLAGRRFNLITDCSALTWLFHSRNLSPKLNRWALRLAEYDIVLRWRAGTENLMPDALSRLPLHTDTEPFDIDDSFPDDPSSSAPNHYVGPRGPTLYNIALADTPPDERGHNDTPLAALFSYPRPTPLVKIPARDHKQHSIYPNMFPFAAYAALDPEAPTTLR